MTRKPPKGKSLVEIHPELAKEWHPTKNGRLTPYDVTAKSGKKVWWKCKKSEEHEWDAVIQSRNNGTGCPFCSGRRSTSFNCLAVTNPKIAKEWHPTKNGKLTPYEFKHKSSKKIWWKCEKGDDHVWEARISKRTLGNGCPICSGKKIVLSNCLATTNPEIAKEWHPIKNGNLTPYDLTANSSRIVWWKCDKGDDHEWRSSPNGVYQKKIRCRICSGTRVVLSNCLATTNSDLAKEWHPTKNGKLTPLMVLEGSNKSVWWKCEKGDDHEWKTAIATRSNQNTGCPICYGTKVVLSNCLAVTNPEIAKEWHPTKNGKLTPYDVLGGGNEKVWWKCDKGDDHEWKGTIRNKINFPKCPICLGQKTVLSNCLATTNPEIAKEWHPTKNGKLTPLMVIEGSNKSVWWKCEKGDDHEWKTAASNRKSGTGCPYCTLTPQSKQELTITFELIQFFMINPKGFKSRVNGKIMSIDIYIQELNLGIEFDGSYWHKDNRDLDKLKTEKLEESGFKIMRVREEPLKEITEIDVISKIPFNAKEVTNNILLHILKTYSMDSKIIQRIEKYIIKEEIQNEKGLNVYIDMILTEKAQRNSSK